MESVLDLYRIDAWTVDDLRRLPDDVDWRRYEIVDGALVVSPGAGLRHEWVSHDIRGLLDRALPAGLAVLGPMGVALGASYRIPDLVVVSVDLRTVNKENLDPSDVRVAVEVVSPGSRTTDRITKPAQYAAAGIPAFWRVETDPLSLTAYRLEPGHSAYTEVGTWQLGEIVRLTEPFPVEIDLAAVAR